MKSLMLVRRVSCCALAAMALSACAVSSPPVIHVTASHVIPQRLQVVSGLPEGEVPGSEASAFYAAFNQALEKHGVTVTPDSAFALTLAVARSGADAGITQSAGATGQPVKWRSAARRHGTFDGCKPQRLRVTVVGGENAQQQAPMADGEVIACRITDPVAGSLANELARQLTQR